MNEHLSVLELAEAIVQRKPLQRLYRLWIPANDADQLWDSFSLEKEGINTDAFVYRVKNDR
jgi:hypothetical protein